MSSTVSKTQIQKTLQVANSSLLFNNSVTHDASLSRPSREGERHFEYVKNPTISSSNHLELLKDSHVIQKLTSFNKQQLSPVHASLRDPNVNIFKLKEGEYENLTYQPKPVNTKKYIPKKSEKVSKGNYKFQMSPKEYNGQFENLPRAGINPFHLVPDINPQMEDLVTSAAPIYNQLSMRNRKHMLDCSALNSKEYESESSLFPIINSQNPFQQNQQIISQNSSTLLVSPTNGNIQSVTINNNNQNNNVSLATSSSQYQLLPSINSKQVGDSAILPISIAAQTTNLGGVTLEASEFELYYKQKALQEKILKDQIHAISQSAKNHPPNFQGKSELAQLAKCLILNANNSPFALKASNSVSLGRSSEQMAKISRFKDPVYFENLCSVDKTDKCPQNILERLTSKPHEVKGQILFGRIAEGIVTQHDPSSNLRYAKKSDQPLRKNQSSHIQLTLKRQNLYRNLASYNFWANSMKISKEDHMEEIDKEFVRPDMNVRKSMPSFAPAFMTQDQKS